MSGYFPGIKDSKIFISFYPDSTAYEIASGNTLSGLCLMYRNLIR